jgi:hypothetical protein
MRIFTWALADTLWRLFSEYAYASIPDSGSRFDVGVYRADIGAPWAVDIVVVGMADYFDWAPDTGHVTYFIDGLYLGDDPLLECTSESTVLIPEGHRRALWKRVSPNYRMQPRSLAVMPTERTIEEMGSD